MEIRKKHSLNKSEVQQRLELAMKNLKDEHEIKTFNIVWSDYLAKYQTEILKIKLEGTISIEEKDLIFNVTIPSAAKLLNGKIKSLIEENLDKVLK